MSLLGKDWEIVEFRRFGAALTSTSNLIAIPFDLRPVPCQALGSRYSGDWQACCHEGSRKVDFEMSMDGVR